MTAKDFQTEDLSFPHVARGSQPAEWDLVCGAAVQKTGEERHKNTGKDIRGRMSGADLNH